MNDYWSKYQQCIASSLASLIVTNLKGETVTSETAFELLCQWTQRVRDDGRTMHFIGNGASACYASHMAVDFTKNAGVRAVAYNDIAFLTAIGNDLGYEQAFAKPLAWFGKDGDVLATISSSGNSPNVIQAIKIAREKSMQVVTFSSMKPDNKSQKAGDLNFFVPAWTYGIAECSHQILVHAWLDSYMKVQEWELTSPQVVIPPV